MAWDDLLIVEINAGLHGFWNVPNSNRVPLGGLIKLRNARLEGRSWRSFGGDVDIAGGRLLGSTYAYPRIAIDYWPVPFLQRTIVAADNGETGALVKHTADFVTATILRSGLTIAGSPYIGIVGAESFDRPRKLIYTNGLGPPQVLAGDGLVTTDLATPAADWGGSHWPRFFVPHQGYAWAGGNENAPHTLYRSTAGDHEDFQYLTTNPQAGLPLRIICGPLDQQQQLVGAISYKGGLLVFASPVGVYFIDTTTSVTATDWVAKLVAYPGAANARCIAIVEDNVMWASPSGTLHALSATQATGSVRASDLTYRKLGTWARDNMAMALYETLATLVYDSEGEAVVLLYPVGTTAQSPGYSLTETLRMYIQPEGEQWSTTDGINIDGIYIRQHAGRPTPVFLKSAQPVIINPSAGSSNAARLEWWMQDTDLSALLPRASGRYKNFHFVQIEYVPRGTVTHTVELWADGAKTQTITMSLTGSGTVLPATVPWTLAPTMPKLTPERKLIGRARRFALRGRTTAGYDTEITKVIVGVSLA